MPVHGCRPGFGVNPTVLRGVRFSVYICEISLAFVDRALFKGDVQLSARRVNRQARTNRDATQLRSASNRQLIGVGKDQIRARNHTRRASLKLCLRGKTNNTLDACRGINARQRDVAVSC